MMRRVCFYALLWSAGCAAGSPRGAAPAGAASPAEASFQRAREAASRGDSVRAEQYLAAALAAGYPEEVVVPQLVRVCVQSNRLRTAVRYVEPYVRRHPDAVALRHLLATLYLAVGEEEAAALELADILELAPDFAASHFVLGMVEVRLGREGGAAHLERYLALEPDGDHAAEARHVVGKRSAQLAPARSRTDG